MSLPSPALDKKAVHVKWAGKTIALGTFPPAEAEEKCAKAKALTRAWRSTMRPKPNREWVMMELERLNVRVVSGTRSSRKDGDEDEEGGSDRKNSLGWATSDADVDAMMQRRTSSIGFSMMSDGDSRRRSSSLGLGTSLGMDDVVMPPHRPLVGGASAAAYEAARADHYRNLAAKKGLGGSRRASSIGMGSPGGAGAGAMPNQHYEMLKLHHMNLLNEIQETTLMMNLYQQQQVQQHRLMQHERAMEPTGGTDYGMYGGGMAGNLSGMGGMDPIGAARRSSSLGLGSSGGLPGSMMPGGLTGSMMPGGGPGSMLAGGGPGSMMSGRGPGMMDKQKELVAHESEKQALEDRLQQIKEEIAKRQKEADELEAASKAKQEEKGEAGSADKRKLDKEGDDEKEAPNEKKLRTEKSE